MNLSKAVRLAVIFLLLLITRSIVLYFTSGQEIAGIPIAIILDALFTFVIILVLILAAGIITHFFRERYSQLPFLSGAVWNLSLIVILALAFFPLFKLFNVISRQAIEIYQIIFLLLLLYFFFRLGLGIFQNIELLMELVTGWLGVSESSRKLCPQCGKKNPSIARYCDNCGKKLKEKITQCPACGATISPDSKFCLTCGEKIPRT